MNDTEKRRLADLTDLMLRAFTEVRKEMHNLGVSAPRLWAILEDIRAIEHEILDEIGEHALAS